MKSKNLEYYKLADKEKNPAQNKRMAHASSTVYLSVLAARVYYSGGYKLCVVFKPGYTDGDLDERDQQVLDEYRANLLIPVVSGYHKRYSATIAEAALKRVLKPYQVTLYRPYRQQFTEEAFVCVPEVLRLFVKVIQEQGFVITPSKYFEGMGDLRNFNKVLEDSIEEVSSDLFEYTILDNVKEDSLTKEQIRRIKADPTMFHCDPYDDDISSDEEEEEDPTDPDWVE